MEPSSLSNHESAVSHGCKFKAVSVLGDQGFENSQVPRPQDKHAASEMQRAVELLLQHCTDVLRQDNHLTGPRQPISRALFLLLSRHNRVENNFLAEESIFEGYEILPAHILGPGSKSFGG